LFLGVKDLLVGLGVLINCSRTENHQCEAGDERGRWWCAKLRGPSSISASWPDCGQVLVNRVLPGCRGSFFRGGPDREIPQGSPGVFAPVPMQCVPLLTREVLGLERIRELARELFRGGEDPAAVTRTERPYSFRKHNGVYEVRLQAPFTDKTEVGLFKKGLELVVEVGTVRRHIGLPSSIDFAGTSAARRGTLTWNCRRQMNQKKPSLKLKGSCPVKDPACPQNSWATRPTRQARSDLWQRWSSQGTSRFDRCAHRADFKAHLREKRLASVGLSLFSSSATGARRLNTESATYEHQPRVAAYCRSLRLMSD
jgi:hypothetical protein